MSAAYIYKVPRSVPAQAYDRFVDIPAPRWNPSLPIEHASPVPHARAAAATYRLTQCKAAIKSHCVNGSGNTNGVAWAQVNVKASMRSRYASAALLLMLVCTCAKESKDSRFPVALIVHAGYRPTLGADVTLYRLAATSYLYSFFTQFKNTPPQPLEIVLWVDTSSYETHIDILEQLLHNLQSLIAELVSDYSWVKPRINFSRGIAESYHRSLRFCEEEDWCKYLMFTEDDWLFEHSNIKHSAVELLDLMDDHDWVNYIRFNKRELKAILFDSPCIVEDKRLPIPLTNTAGFSNNAHLCKAGAVQRLFELVHDARTSGQNWGLECHQDMAK